MSAAWNDEERRRLGAFVTSTERPVYCLRNLPEEVVAVLFAYYSRSRETLRENLLRLLAEGDLDVSATPPDLDAPARLAEAREKARAFHEKWVVGYGHSSVAEHAVVHVAVEGVSILASKVIEDARLASFTEKSTRYVPFDTKLFHTPEVFAAPPEQEAYREGIGALTSAYDRLMEPLVAHFLDITPAVPGRTEKGRQNACRAQACDVLRYLLPAATRTNLGMTINSRALEALITKMLSHPLEEARAYGRWIQEEALQIVPTLIQHAAPSAYRSDTERRARELALTVMAGGARDGESAAPGGAPGGGAAAATGVRLVRYDVDSEERVVESILYAASDRPAEEVRRRVGAMGVDDRLRIIDDYVSRRGRHDPPLRAFESTRYTFEIVVDYGAYRDIQRHRLASQFPQRLSFDLGCERPRELEAAGMAADFDRAVATAAEAWRRLSASHPEEAQYVVPLACRRRVLMEMNLRELHHFIQLRSARQGHASYRRVAREMQAEVARVHPGLAAMIRVDTTDYDLARG